MRLVNSHKLQCGWVVKKYKKLNAFCYHNDYSCNCINKFIPLSLQKLSKRVGPCNTVDTNISVGTKQSDSLKMFELSMELEATKLNNTTLKHEIDDLKQRIANIRSSEQYEDESIQNNFQIIENLISERNDLRELLDKFLGVTDQIIELKIQADQMKNIESEYILLQTKFREHQTELEALRSEKQTFEERLMNLQNHNDETNSLKVIFVKSQMPTFCHATKFKSVCLPGYKIFFFFHYSKFSFWWYSWDNNVGKT